MLTNTFVIQHSVSGALTAAAGALQYPLPVAADLVRVQAYAATAPVGANVLVDVNKNGTTVWPTQSQRLTITAGQSAGVVNPALDANNGVNQIAPTVTQTPPIATFAQGDRVSVDVDQIGSGTAGSNLVVVLEFKAK